MSVFRNFHLSEKCILFIPTRNRTEFLNVALNYYSKYNNCPKIVIADSSKKDFLSANVKLISRYASRLNIEHKIFNENVSFLNKIKDGLSGITGFEFVAIAADDDFLVLDTAKKCIRFLMASKNHVSAAGALIKMDINVQNVGGIRKTILPTTCLADAAITRAECYVQNRKQRFYGVHRIQAFVDSVQDAINTEMEDVDIFSEFFLYLSLMMRGKFFCIREVGYIQLIHDKSSSSNIRNNVPIIDQEMYETKKKIAVGLLSNWLVKTANCSDISSAKIQSAVLIEDLFEVSRATMIERQERIKNNILRRAVFVVKQKVLYKLISIQNVISNMYGYERIDIKSPDPWFTMRMRMRNSSLQHVLSDINSDNLVVND